MKQLVKVCSLAVLGLSVPSAILAQAKLIEKVSVKNGEVAIPYEKYKLPNGLTVIVHEDHSDPIVHVDVTYHVGSAREQIGKSGFAHFFEHMMFQGSDNVADEQHFKLITEAGGTLNGTTNRDRTNYFETVPNNQLEKMLWLEADRMGFLLNAVTQQKFEVQRATVKNERGQNYDNRPYGLVSEVTSKNLYPYGHPYSWLTIGYIEDLNRVNVDDLKNFFLRWYGPNNAVLTVGGDVSTAAVLKLAEKYFGPIPKGPEVSPVQLAAPVLDKTRYISMMDNYAKTPMLRLVFPTSPHYSKDEAALDCLAEIIGQGNNSILYKNLVKTQKAVSASAVNSASELSGEFTISVTPFPGQKLAELEQAVRASFTEFEKRGATDDEISKFKNQVESQTIYSLESVSQKVSQLASYQTFTGNANYIGQDLKRYRDITKEDVMRVYNQYVKGKNSVVVSVLTKGQDDNKAAPDNYTVDTTHYTMPNYGYAGLKYNKAKDNFDRSVIPASSGNPKVNVPKLWEEKLPNNGKVIGTREAEMPVVDINMEFRGGMLTDAADPSKQGVANLFAVMMNEDTRNYTAEDFTTALQKLGSDIRVYAGKDAIGINIKTLKKNLQPTLALLQERILNTQFKQETFESKKKQTIEGVKNAMNRPNYIASVVFDKVMYGKDNVLGWTSAGTEATIANISLADLQSYYKNNFSSNDVKVVVVGDVDSKAMVSELKFLDKMPNNVVSIPVIPAAPAAGATKVYFVDVPNAAQTEFRVGYVTNMKYDVSGNFYKANLINYPLGGAFNSRLNLYLREDKGWTYGARSVFAGDLYSGDFTFSGGIKANATDSALQDVIRILKEYKTSGMTEEELLFTKNSIGQSEARKYESGSQKASFLSRLMTYNLSPTYPNDQSALLSAINVGEARSFAQNTVPGTDKLNIVLVGDKAKLWDRLKNLGYDMVELDKNGNVKLN
ncbi:MAG: insulinase family protein [Chitinophagaceae bacterium]|nr:insulinase family protein [Chitinophagaceae bacterium]